MTSTHFTPVFVSGSARSGTTLLAHLLSTHPAFGTYRAETLLLSVCRVKYGDIFNCHRKREVFLQDWFRSRQFRESKLSHDDFLQLIESSSNYEQLTLNFLAAIARHRDARYIVDSTPANVSYLENLFNENPGSQFINVVRDGRDVAISQVKLGWSNPPFPYKSKADHLHYALIQWALVLDRVEHQSNAVPILRIKYEELLATPDNVVAAVKRYLNLPDPQLDTALIGHHDEANSAFGRLGEQHNGSPVGRWKQLEKKTLNSMTYGLSEKLIAYGYDVPHAKFSPRLALRLVLFRAHIKIKRMLVKHPGLGKLSSLALEIDN